MLLAINAPLLNPRRYVTPKIFLTNSYKTSAYPAGGQRTAEGTGASEKCLSRKIRAKTPIS